MYDTTYYDFSRDARLRCAYFLQLVLEHPPLPASLMHRDD